MATSNQNSPTKKNSQKTATNSQPNSSGSPKPEGTVRAENQPVPETRPRRCLPSFERRGRRLPNLPFRGVLGGRLRRRSTRGLTTAPRTPHDESFGKYQHTGADCNRRCRCRGVAPGAFDRGPIQRPRGRRREAALRRQGRRLSERRRDHRRADVLPRAPGRTSPAAGLRGSMGRRGLPFLLLLARADLRLSGDPRHRSGFAASIRSLNGWFIRIPWSPSTFI